MLDGAVRHSRWRSEVIKVKGADGALREEPMTIRRSVHGPVVADRNGMTVAMRVAAIDRPRLFEQFWRMGLAHNLDEWQDGDADAATADLQHRLRRSRRPHRAMSTTRRCRFIRPATIAYWQGVVPGDRSDLIASTIVPYDQVPKVIDPPTGWVQNSNDMPWTSVYPMMLDSTTFAAGFAAPMGITQRAQRGIRILSGFTGRKMTFADVKAGKLSTRVETADQFVDDLVAAARQPGTRSRQARRRRPRRSGIASRRTPATACCCSTSS